MLRINKLHERTTKGRATVAEASIPVDLFNPGQVFACLGFAEAAEILLRGAEGAFDWSRPNEARFWLSARGDASPVARVLEFLSKADARAQVPAGSAAEKDWKAAWGKLETRPTERGFPFPDPPSPATALCILTDGVDSIPVDHWGDGTRRDNVKFWAGGAGYPGVALARDALELARPLLADAATNPFAVSAPQSSSFRFDWRRDYIPIDAGFSLNAHGGKIETVGFPLVELLAAIGVTHARPKRTSPRDKLAYGYAALSRTQENPWFPLSFLRAALGGAPFPFPMRRFRMVLSWPGKEGQARAITNVVEETMR